MAVGHGSGVQMDQLEELLSNSRFFFLRDSGVTRGGTCFWLREAYGGTHHKVCEVCGDTHHRRKFEVSAQNQPSLLASGTHSEVYLSAAWLTRLGCRLL